MGDYDLRQFAAALGKAGDDAAGVAEKVIEKGANAIKKRMREDAKGHRHFSRLAPSITYDMRSTGSAIEAEIGPRLGTLAGIAYFGSSRPGGETVEDPQKALDAEAPKVEFYLSEAIGGVLP